MATRREIWSMTRKEIAADKNLRRRQNHILNYLAPNYSPNLFGPGLPCNITRNNKWKEVEPLVRKYGKFEGTGGGFDFYTLVTLYATTTTEARAIVQQIKLYCGGTGIFGNSLVCLPHKKEA